MAVFGGKDTKKRQQEDVTEIMNIRSFNPEVSVGESIPEGARGDRKHSEKR